jgi:hypothetical protein
MALSTVSRAAAAALLLLVLAGVGVGCGQAEPTAGGQLQEGAEEAFREGLFEELDGLSYKVFITRQLNESDPEDRGYFQAADAGPGQIYYGVFIQVCNMEEEPLRAAGDFKMVDTQENEFRPVALPMTNVFAYRPKTIRPDGCIPDQTSVVAQSPAGGALLLFRVPLETTENRPLVLEIQDGFDAEGEPRTLSFELDI